jgi:hypothetical protein
MSNVLDLEIRVAMNIGREIIPAPQNDMVKLTDNIIANKWNSEVFASKKIQGHSPK